MDWQKFKNDDEINVYTQLCNAKALEFTFEDDTILFISKRYGDWLAMMHDPYTCTNCWDEPKMFKTFDELLDYIVELQKNELESFAESLSKYTKNVKIDWDDEKVQDVILEKIEIRKFAAKF